MDCYTNEVSWIEPLPDGHLGTLRTLQTMAWLCRKDSCSPFVRATTRDLFRRQPHTPAVAVLFHAARDGITYTPDPPNLEKVSDFQHTTQSGTGDCDDKVVWLATALLSWDVPVRFVVQSYGAGQWDHVYVEFWDRENWCWEAADPTADGHTGFVADLGWRQPLPAGGAEMTYEV